MSWDALRELLDDAEQRQKELESVVPLLYSCNAGLRFDAVRVMAKAGTAIEPHVNKLKRLIAYKPCCDDERLCHVALLALLNAGPAGLKAVAELLAHRESKPRRRALEALEASDSCCHWLDWSDFDASRLQEMERKLAPQLAACLLDDRRDSRAAAARLLRRVASNSTQLLDALPGTKGVLQTAMQSNESDVRTAAQVALSVLADAHSDRNSDTSDLGPSASAAGSDHPRLGRPTLEVRPETAHRQLAERASQTSVAASHLAGANETLEEGGEEWLHINPDPAPDAASHCPRPLRASSCPPDVFGDSASELSPSGCSSLSARIQPRAVLLSKAPRPLASLGSVAHGTSKCLVCLPHLRGECQLGYQCHKCHDPTHADEDSSRPGGRKRNRAAKHRNRQDRTPSPEP